jgi:hypothetical protein
MIYLIAIFVGIGAALVGWAFGLALFSAVFALLRPLELSVLLDSELVLLTFRFAFAAIGLTSGIWLLRRWRPRPGVAAPSWKILALATFAGIGGAPLGVPLVALITGVMLGVVVSPDTAFVCLVPCMILGASLAAIAYGQSASWITTVLRGALASMIAVAAVWGGYKFENSDLTLERGRLGQPRAVIIDIDTRHNRDNRPALATVRIAMRSEEREIPGQILFWHPENSQWLLRVRVPLMVGTRDRTVVLSLPNEPERLLRLDLPSNPRTERNFGPWLRFEPAVRDGQPAAEAYAARYYVY